MDSQLCVRILRLPKGFPDVPTSQKDFVALRKGDFALVVETSEVNYSVWALTRYGIVHINSTEFWTEGWDGPDELPLNNTL